MTKKEIIEKAAGREWYMLSEEEVLTLLGSSVDGLLDKEAASRLEGFGANVLAEEEKTPILRTALHQFRDPLIYLLLIAGAVTILLRDFVDAGVIFAAVILNAIIGFIQHYKAEASIRALKKLLALKATVIRGGFEEEINAELIVPGDIVLLQTGQKIPADLRLIHEKEFKTDESAFSGESVPVSKISQPIPEPGLQVPEQANMAFVGSVIASGRATGVVTATGAMTQLGEISEEVRTAVTVKTPMEGRIEVLTRFIILAIAASSAIGFIFGAAFGEDPLQLLVTLIAVAVSAIPEGLPVALTIALAVAVNRMAKRNAIIRSLPAIETLGSSTAIGSDKTGTLTRNEMMVQRIWAGGNSYRAEGPGYEPAGSILRDSRKINANEDELLKWTLRIGLLATESNLVREDDIWRAHGDPTEVALIVSASRGGMDREEENEAYLQIDILPFESEIQYMATLNKYDEKSYLLVKGAPEKLLSLSKEIARSKGEKMIDEASVMEAAHEFADQGLRVLAMAYKEMPSGTAEITHDDVNDLIFVGMQGMLDPPRPEAIDAIRHAKTSGIKVVMITGDNPRTGLSIAKMMGIVEEDDTAMTGRDLDAASDEELREILQTARVFARVSPHHKHRIVDALKAGGEIVAVTGDGVNDAAAIKAAHVGVAMGITGTDVAKEASDMVVVDDNFASIYHAIVQGRVAFDNIRKVTYFLLATGAGEIVAITATLVSGMPLIFLPAQILWVNLVTNGLQDVALAFEPKERGVERRRPRNPKEGILNRTLLIRLGIIGLIQAAASLGIFAAELARDQSLAHARTMAVTTVVFAQFFHVFNSRSERTSVFRQNPTKNHFLLYSMMAAFAAQMAFIYAPFMQSLFRTTPLTGTELLIVALVASSVLFGSEIDKLRLKIKESRKRRKTKLG